MARPIIIKKFNSAGAFLEWASNAPCQWRRKLSSRKTDYDTRSFTGTDNYEEAYKLAKYGWEEGLKTIKP